MGLMGAGIVIAQPQPNQTISFRSQTKRIFVLLGIPFGLGGIAVVGILYLNDIRVLHLNDNLDPLTWKQWVAIVIGFPLFYLLVASSSFLNREWGSIASTARG